MNLVAVFRAQRQATNVLKQTLDGVTRFFRTVRANAALQLQEAVLQGELICFSFSDGTRERIPIAVVDDTPERLASWWKEREGSIEREFSAWQLATARNMLTSRKAALEKAAAELVELETNHLKRFGVSPSEPTY